MHVQRVGYALDGDLLVERVIVDISRFDAPCAETKRGGLLKGGIVCKISV